MPAVILIVDDDDLVLQSLKMVLRAAGYRVKTADRGSKALKILEKEEVDLVITDLKMPSMSGVELLDRIYEMGKDMPVIMITAYATVETAVDAMKKGAFDYIMKPFSADEIELLVKRALEDRRLRRENHKLREVIKQENSPVDFTIIGEDEKMKALMRMIERVANSDVTVLIQGESGTGKELFARAIHTISNRREFPYIRMNCAAIPETLMESELFGYEKGAFTGAVASKPGKFELADKGTILLDEIGEMPLHLQAKLLRVLQEKEIDRLGGRQTVKVDTRVIATTNRNLAKEVKEGRFREDLFFRLNVLPLYIPPLRERRDDIPLLARHFLAKFNKRIGKSIRAISDPAMSLLMEYSWPGNVRELENCILRAAILCDGDIIEKEQIMFSYAGQGALV